MSSGSFDVAGRTDLFRWPPPDPGGSWAVVTYDVVSDMGPEETALAMAMEQSAATVDIPGFVVPDMLGHATARVVSIEPVEEGGPPEVTGFELPTDVYRAGAAVRSARSRVKLAFPDRLLMARPSQWLNVLVGEIPRLGFIRTLQVVEIELPLDGLSGPRLGVKGLRQRLGGIASPLLCRSMRPGVGLSREVMARLNSVVWTSGFHVVKDDELLHFGGSDELRDHLRTMAEVKARAQDATGERKLFVVNAICEPEELFERAAIAEELGADGLLVAPAIQGLGVLRALSARSGLPLLAHQTFSEMFTRHPRWRIAPAVFARLQRALGADWLVTPGPFGTRFGEREEDARFARVCSEPWGSLSASMPILQGGKNPAGLLEYRRAIGSRDFMLITASWIDQHPGGLGEGARRFREAVDALS